MGKGGEEWVVCLGAGSAGMKLCPYDMCRWIAGGGGVQGWSRGGRLDSIGEDTRGGERE